MLQYNPTIVKLDLGVVGKALELARGYHATQTRWDGEPYYEHLVRVANTVLRHGYDNTATVAAAILHDIVEDTVVTLNHVEVMFGADIAGMVDRLTQRPGESRDVYFGRLFANVDTRVVAVKFGDRIDNLRGLHTCPAWRREETDHVEDYFREVEQFFMPNIQYVNNTLGWEFQTTHAQARSLCHAVGLTAREPFETMRNNAA